MYLSICHYRFAVCTVLYQKRFRRERKIRIRYQQQLGVEGNKGNPNSDNSAIYNNSDICTGGSADAKCSSGSDDAVETIKGNYTE